MSLSDDYLRKMHSAIVLVTDPEVVRDVQAVIIDLIASRSEIARLTKKLDDARAFLEDGAAKCKQ